jgi:hypothetical protein
MLGFALIQNAIFTQFPRSTLRLPDESIILHRSYNFPDNCPPQSGPIVTETIIVEGIMQRKVKIGLSVGLLILAIADLIWISMPQPAPLDMESPVAAEAKSVITQMFLLEHNITCVPGTTIDVLAEVMVDSSDYHASSTEKKAIERVYGKQALNHAGLLTSKQSYYLSRDIEIPVVPTPGTGPTPVPTKKPTYYCTPDFETSINQILFFKEISQGQDGRVIVSYSYVGNDFEAILRRTEDQLKISSIKLVKWYGNG